MPKAKAEANKSNSGLEEEVKIKILANNAFLLQYLIYIYIYHDVKTEALLYAKNFSTKGHVLEKKGN